MCNILLLLLLYCFRHFIIIMYYVRYYVCNITNYNIIFIRIFKDFDDKL